MRRCHPQHAEDVAEGRRPLAHADARAQEEGRVRRPELHHPTLLRLPGGGRVADVVILVHERVEVFEVLDPMTCIEVGLRQQLIVG